MASGVAFTNFLENEVLDHVFGGAAYTAPTTVVCALYTVSPGEATAGTEVSGGSYARQTVSFGTASAGVIANDAEVDFGTATADWGTVAAAALLDDAGTPNIMCYGNLTASKAVGNGDSFSFAIGNLTVSLD